MSSKRPNKGFEPIIEVTPGDVQYAKRHDRFNCAIVRAIQRQYPEAVRVLVDTERISFAMDDDRRYDWETPQPVVDKLIKPFDTKGPEALPEKFSFKLRGGTSREVVHADTRTKREKRIKERGSRQIGKRIEKLPNCEYNRFREDLSETEVSE